MVWAVALLVFAGVLVLCTLTVISNTGKPRKPLGPPEVAWIVMINAASIVILVLAALRIGV
jgi:hypothetical protein